MEKREKAVIKTEARKGGGGDQERENIFFSVETQRYIFF
jgi:hypothetical protein